jgi:cobaltochelatase CobT
VFFIPIVTPTAVKSKFCKHEFDAFLVRERALGRDDLVFPLYYIRVPALEHDAEWPSDPLLSIIGQRQWTDWRDLRLLDVQDTRVREAIAQFCAKVADALERRVASPEERRKRADADRHAAEAAETTPNPDPANIGSASWESFQRAQAELKRRQVEAKRLDTQPLDTQRRRQAG